MCDFFCAAIKEGNSYCYAIVLLALLSRLGVLLMSGVDQSLRQEAERHRTRIFSVTSERTCVISRLLAALGSSSRVAGGRGQISSGGARGAHGNAIER
jgi:hypothetical protein